MVGTKFYLRYNSGKSYRPQVFMDEVEVVSETAKRFTISHNGKPLIFIKETLEVYKGSYGKLLPINGKFAAEKKALDEINRVIYLKEAIAYMVNRRDGSKLEKMSPEKLEQIYKIMTSEE
jgi:hypothetical protein